jgi:CBS domain-containing protein
MPIVQDILDRKGRDVVSVESTDSVLMAARLMNDRGIGGVVVTEGGRVVGIFTERDVLRRVVAEQRDPARTPVGDVMTAPVLRCRPDTRLDDCRALMTERRIRHLPVEDGDDLRGIITTGDLLAHHVREQQDKIEFLNSYVFDLR